jgi:hypothetical protein
MRLLLVAATALLLTAPVASAHHEWNWESTDATDVGDSGCSPIDPECVAAYACTGGAPPQVVDLVLHCAVRASNEAEDVALWVPYYAWMWADWGTAVGEDSLFIANGAVGPTVAEVNTVLCDTVWSFFCSNPLAIPDHMPISDPVTDYPL